MQKIKSNNNINLNKFDLSDKISKGPLAIYYKIIERSKYLQEVIKRDDEEILTEVIQDFMAEADSAIVAFKRAMKSNSFLSIEQEAHKIKGTAAYLHCPELVAVSLQLQEKGNEGVSGRANAVKLWKDVEKLYDNFVIALSEFRSEVSSKGYK